MQNYVNLYYTDILATYNKILKYMPYITKQFKFCAAHKYWNNSWDHDQNFKVFGDDIRVHGHNYVLDVMVTGPINQESGFIFDIQELKQIVNSLPGAIFRLSHNTIL